MVVYGMVMSLVLLSPLGRSKGKKHQDLSSARDMEREKKKLTRYRRVGCIREGGPLDRLARQDPKAKA